MKTSLFSRPTSKGGFTLVEVMVTMTIVVVTVSLALSTFVYGIRIMYKDRQRLASNASLRTFMAQISNETLNSSFYYLFEYYTALDGSVRLVAQTTPTVIASDVAQPSQTYDNANNAYDRWAANGDCLVLVTHTSLYRTSDIRQIRIYYRVTKDQNTTTGKNLNAEAELRYYETADWGEGPAPTTPVTVGASNGHLLSALATELSNINLNANPSLTGSKVINARSLGRLKPASTDRYPIFSTLSPTASPTSGCISINVEFINGTTANNMLSSSSFNYTVSPRK